MSAPADKASAGAAAANGQVRDDRGEQAADIPARYASGEHLRIKAGFGAPILLSWFLGCDSAAHSAIVAWYVENVRLGAELLCDPDYLVLDDMLAVDLSLLPRDAEESYDLIGMTRQEVIDFAAAAPGRLDPTVVVFQAVQRAAAKRADPQPIPLIQRVEVPPFPMDALPKVYADMAAATAVSAQIDPALTGCLALGSLAVCATGTARVYIHDTWSEPVNLYLTAVADVGERKSAAKAAMFEPLYAFERELREAAGPVIARAAEERKKVERDLAAARKADSTDDPFTVAENLSRIEVPAMPQLMVGDATPEALERLLGEQNGRISVVSDEGGIFDIFAGRYSNNGEASFEVMLKGHSGDSVSVARISRPNVYIDHAAISVCVIMQPSVLSKIAAHGDFDGRPAGPCPVRRDRVPGRQPGIHGADRHRHLQRPHGGAARSRRRAV
jgi:Protein of unknown function (DUF3987)